MDSQLRELVEYIARALVDQADAVQVSEAERDHATRLELRVAKTDLGKVIGKNGNTARAIRTVVSAASAKLHRRALLNIVED